MAVRDILTVPDPRLKEISAPVEGPVTDEHRALMDDMLETMYAAPGIGLAAIQIGVPLRIIVMDLSENGDAPSYFVNPEVLETVSETKPYEEGCLSVPDVFDEVDRPARCLLRYLNYQGETIEEWAEDLYAVCVQHEIDHLNGVVFIDYLSRLKRQRAVDKVRKIQRQKAHSTA
ncbi:MAG: peptide deformylase [Pseudomonadota bacterium]